MITLRHYYRNELQPKSDITTSNKWRKTAVQVGNLTNCIPYLIGRTISSQSELDSNKTFAIYIGASLTIIAFGIDLYFSVSRDCHNSQVKEKVNQTDIQITEDAVLNPSSDSEKENLKRDYIKSLMDLS